MDRCGLMRLQDLLKQGVTVNLKNRGNALATHKSPAATASLLLGTFAFLRLNSARGRMLSLRTSNLLVSLILSGPSEGDCSD